MDPLNDIVMKRIIEVAALLDQEKFDNYEFLGSQKQTKASAQHKLGAHLHLFPALVLPTVNVAMLLAIATLWISHNLAGYNLKRFLETSNVGKEQKNSRTNEVTKHVSKHDAISRQRLQTPSTSTRPIKTKTRHCNKHNR